MDGTRLRYGSASSVCFAMNYTPHTYVLQASRLRFEDVCGPSGAGAACVFQQASWLSGALAAKGAPAWGRSFNTTAEMLTGHPVDITVAQALVSKNGEHTAECAVSSPLTHGTFRIRCRRSRNLCGCFITKRASRFQAPNAGRLGWMYRCYRRL